MINDEVKFMMNQITSCGIPTDLESPGESGNFAGGQRLMACTIRLCNCRCNIVSGEEHDVLFWIV